MEVDGEEFNGEGVDVDDIGGGEVRDGDSGALKSVNPGQEVIHEQMPESVIEITGKRVNG